MKKIVLTILFVTLNIINAEAHEVKLGLMQHDPDKKLKKHRYEKEQNIIFEYLFSEENIFLWGTPHIGASINTKGYTSNIYTGLSWKMEIFKPIFIEATFGAALNNGEQKAKYRKRRAIGSNLLFRESFSIGANFDEYNSLSLMIDHMSSANITLPNPGLTDIGIRYGYKF